MCDVLHDVLHGVLGGVLHVATAQAAAATPQVQSKRDVLVKLESGGLVVRNASLKVVWVDW